VRCSSKALSDLYDCSGIGVVSTVSWTVGVLYEAFDGATCNTDLSEMVLCGSGLLLDSTEEVGVYIYCEMG
jgi:hypothetical protein